MIYIILQILFLVPSFTYHGSFNFIYLFILSNLIIKRNKVINHIFLAFLIGFVIDVFMQNGGNCISAATFFIYLRYVLAKSVIPITHLNQGIYINTRSGILLYLLLIILPIFIHNLIFYLYEYIDVPTIDRLELITKKTLFSSIYTTLTFQIINILKFIFRKYRVFS